MGRPTQLYLVEMSDQAGSEVFFKVGVTRDVEWRFGHGLMPLPPSAERSQLRLIQEAILAEKRVVPHPYRVKKLCVIRFDSEEEANGHELEILEVMLIAGYWPTKWFSGAGECFLCDREIVDDLKTYMQSLGPAVENGT